MKTIELEDEELETIIESLEIARDYWREEIKKAYDEDEEGLGLAFANWQMNKNIDLGFKLEEYDNDRTEGEPRFAKGLDESKPRWEI